jgi:DNA repair exonuclease SbcCD ATPase subunit
VQYNPLTSVQKRIDEVKRMLSCLETELDEQKDLLSHFSEKTKSAKSNFDILKKACKEIRDELVRLCNEKNCLAKWVYEFKHSNDDYLEIQNIVKEKVDAFLTEYNGRKLLEFALTAAAEALRQDPQREELAEKTPSLMNYDFDPEILFFPNPYNYSDLEKEKIFERASEIYDKLVEGLTGVVISTAPGLVPSTPS